MVLVGCGSAPPSASDGKWNLAPERKGKSYVFDASVRLRGGRHGWFTPNLTLMDAKGCVRDENLETIFPIKMSNPDDFLHKFHQAITE